MQLVEHILDFVGNNLIYFLTMKDLNKFEIVTSLSYDSRRISFQRKNKKPSKFQFQLQAAKVQPVPRGVRRIREADHRVEPRPRSHVPH